MLFYHTRKKEKTKCIWTWTSNPNISKQQQGKKQTKKRHLRRQVHERAARRLSLWGGRAPGGVVRHHVLEPMSKATHTHPCQLQQKLQWRWARKASKMLQRQRTSHAIITLQTWMHKCVQRFLLMRLPKLLFKAFEVLRLQLFLHWLFTTYCL